MWIKSPEHFCRCLVNLNWTECIPRLHAIVPDLRKLSLRTRYQYPPLTLVTLLLKRRVIAAKRHLLGRQNHCVRGRQHHRIWTLIWGGGNHVAYRPYYYVLLRTTTHPCARNKFFKHSHNFLWALPSWKSLAPVHKMIGKITRKNIINICSSYRPCPVRRNMAFNGL